MIKKIILILFFINLSHSYILAKNNVFIVASINDEIITNYDLQREGEYLKILNPKLNQLNDDQLLNIAKTSLINEIIKKKEILKRIDLQNNVNPFLDDYLNNLYSKLNYNNIDEFENALLKQDIYNINQIKDKLNIELYWNDIIYNKYSNQIKIDKEKIKKKLKSFELQEKIEEYLISEIYIYEENIDKLNKKIKIVVKDIEEKSFEYAAINYSKSASAENEGKLDWMNEKEINDKMLSEIKKLKVGEVSDPIQDMSGIFFFKLNDKKETENKINLNIELKKILDREKNKQLNFFSSNHFNKLKEHSIIKIINE